MDTKKIAQGLMSALIFLAPVLTEPSLAWQQGKGEDRLPPAAIEIGRASCRERV